MLEMSKRPFFSDLSLHDVTAEFSEDGLRQRLSYEVSQAGWDDEIRQRLRLAEELAIEAHMADTRGIHPYSTHFLRVTARIISQNHLAVLNSDLLIAALLHDTVENNVEFYNSSEFPNTNGTPPRKHALQVIRQLFGRHVSELVSAVTNPERPAEITERHARYEFYRQHVREVLVSNEEAGILKLSDFIDNCTGLDHNESPELAFRLADKYFPLIPDFYAFANRSTLISDDRKQYIFDQLERAEELCIDLLHVA